MKTTNCEFKVGQRIVYNDGRPGHTNAKATVLCANRSAMVVQFDDRADTTTICFSDAAWMRFISAEVVCA
jgi:hypothetical protein